MTVMATQPCRSLAYVDHVGRLLHERHGLSERSASTLAYTLLWGCGSDVVVG